MATADSRRRQPTDDMRSHYDIHSLKGAVRGKYAARYAAGPNVVRLAPDVAPSFKSDTDVNAALRRYLRATAGAGSRQLSDGQLLESLLNERLEAVVTTIEHADGPLTLVQIRRRCSGATTRTIQFLLDRCEAEGRLHRVRARGIDRWLPASKKPAKP
jgi:hypothetical protein